MESRTFLNQKMANPWRAVAVGGTLPTRGKALAQMIEGAQNAYGDGPRVETVMAKATKRRSAKSGRKTKRSKRAKPAVKARGKRKAAVRSARKAKVARKAKTVRKARPKAKSKGILARIAGAFHTVEETVQETQALRNKMEPPGTAETQ